MAQPHQGSHHTATKRRRTDDVPELWADALGSEPYDSLPQSQYDVQMPYSGPSDMMQASQLDFSSLPMHFPMPSVGAPFCGHDFDTAPIPGEPGNESLQDAGYVGNSMDIGFLCNSSPADSGYQTGISSSLTTSSGSLDLQTSCPTLGIDYAFTQQLSQSQSRPLFLSYSPYTNQHPTPPNLTQTIDLSDVAKPDITVWESSCDAQTEIRSTCTARYQTEEPEPELVCFGTVTITCVVSQGQTWADSVSQISAITGRCAPRVSGEIPSSFPVHIDSSDCFSAKTHLDVQGNILPDHGQMIQGLLDEPTLLIFASCTPNSEPASKRTVRSTSQMSCILDITLYGPLDLYHEIGDWLQDYDAYLQDPLFCHRDAKYCNPQRISSDDIDSCPMVSEVVSRSSNIAHAQDITERPDVLDILSSNDDLEETAQPTAIRSTLKRHQKQALTFMLRREQGWVFEENQQDIWNIIDTDRGRYFVNRISGSHQTEEPEAFFGGIIADPMGLGKTLTMISLAATDLDREWVPVSRPTLDEGDMVLVDATLVIVPPSLLGTWEEQLSEHVTSGRLAWHRHHGKARLDDEDELDGINVVLTTYHTVSTEWRTGSAPQSSVLFSVRWRRIVLDEAHVIRNGSSRMARAVCSLSSDSRWAVTGTPIQNRLNDLATLVRFIRAYPYTDPKQFEADISRLWKSGDDEEAVKRLKMLSVSLILRRSKGTISLPPKRDLRCPIEFNHDERALYDKYRQQTISRIDEALHKDSETSRAGVYVNVLQQIESLRLVCNLGLRYETRHSKPSQAVNGTEDWASIAQQTFDIQRGMRPIVCLQCASTLDLTETVIEEPASSKSSPRFSRCLKFICGDCAQKSLQSKHTIVCSHTPSCPMSQVSIHSSFLEEVPDEVPPALTSTTHRFPSKIEALVADVKSLASDVKCIIFSTWRLTLDVVEAGLKQAGISTLRFDGKVPQKERQSVVEKFRKDPTVRVMLLTLTSGAVGLNLTVASRAYLMEPHWNPNLEEQALARVHRIGQEREVTTVRFYVRDSFEERVMEVQQSKKQLAGVLLSPHDGGQGDDSLGGLHRLRSLL